MPPAARQHDTVAGTDTHLVATPASPPAPTPFPFTTSTWTGGLATDVFVDGRPAVVMGAQIAIVPPHPPPPPPASFATPPLNQGSVSAGSATVLINSSPAARQGDAVTTCNDGGPPVVPARITTGSGLVVIG